MPRFNDFNGKKYVHISSCLTRPGSRAARSGYLPAVYFDDRRRNLRPAHRQSNAHGRSSGTSVRFYADVPPSRDAGAGPDR